MRFNIKYLLIFGFVVGGRALDENGNCTASNAEKGKCVSLNECPSLHSMFTEIINGTFPSNTTLEFERSFCTDRSLFCCPDSELSKTREGSTLLADPIQQLLPENCGDNILGDRIINGQDASLYSWPWIALLRGRANNRRYWFCGGTLISDRYVLTAAHCLKENPSLEMEFVRIGEHDLTTDIDCQDNVCAPPVQDIPVEESITHPDYKGQPCLHCNDIALLRLSEPVEMHTNFVNSVCLPFRADSSIGFKNQRLQNISAKAAGWGSTNADSKNRPNVLQEVRIAVQNNAYCDFLKRRDGNPSATFCGGGRGKDTCNGDSGGPVTITSSENERSYLVGVTSAGPSRCGSANTLGIYTNVHHYMPWILSNMRL